MTKKLRRGYTTGTCAQAATKAAVTMLLGNVSVDQVTVSLPGKEVLTLKIAEAQKEFNKYKNKCRFASCVHINEPDCEIKRQVEEENISRIRYKNYLLMYEEIKAKRRY